MAIEGNRTSQMLGRRIKSSRAWPEEPLDRNVLDDLPPGQSLRSKSIAARTLRRLVPTSLNKVTVTITRTTDGARDYMQIISDDMFTVNVVFIAGKIEVQDRR